MLAFTIIIKLIILYCRLHQDDTEKMLELYGKMKDSGKGTNDLFLLMMVNMGLAIVGGGDGDRNTCIRRRRDGDLDVYIRLSMTYRLSRTVYKASSIRCNKRPRAKPGFQRNSSLT